MNLIELYGPTITLKQLCTLLNISRSSYYNYIDKSNPNFKDDLPSSIDGFGKKIFRTQDVQSYLTNSN